MISCREKFGNEGVYAGRVGSGCYTNPCGVVLALLCRCITYRNLLCLPSSARTFICTCCQTWDQRRLVASCPRGAYTAISWVRTSPDRHPQNINRIRTIICIEHGVIHRCIMSTCTSSSKCASHTVPRLGPGSDPPSRPRKRCVRVRQAQDA